MPATITAYTTFVAATKAKSAKVNENFSNHRGTLVPIEEDTATSSDTIHDLGQTDSRWKLAHVKAGYWSLGDIKIHHSYNGAAPIDEGWMLCDGRTITSANYDTEHSAGSWTKYIVSSALENKMLPDMISKYFIGVANTTQDGSSTITSVGNTGNVSDIQHFHSVTAHNHQWYQHNGDNNNPQSYNSLGNVSNITGISFAGTNLGYIPVNTVTGSVIDALSSNYTTKNGSTSETSGASALDIRPESVQAQYYMRVI